MKTTIEKINGVEHTVVWYGSWSNGLLPSGRNWVMSPHGYINIMQFYPNSPFVGATALPPLPRNPTADDAKLLYLYMAYGLYPVFKFKEYKGEGGEEYQIRGLSNCSTFYTELHENEIEYSGRYYNDNDGITHAIDEQGNRVEVAIIDKEDK